MSKISPTQIAKKWKVSRTTVYDKMNSGELSYTTSGKSRLVDVSEVIRVFGSVQEKHTEKTDVTATLQQQNTDIAQELADIKKELQHQKELFNLLEKNLSSEQERTVEQKQIIEDYRNRETKLLESNRPKGLLSWIKG